MKNLLPVFVITMMLFSCNSKQRITQEKDYKRYLTQTSLTANPSYEQEIQFWSDRIKTNPGDAAAIAKLAQANAAVFKINGKYERLLESDSLYKVLLHKDPNNAEILQALATNAITQHKFQEAKRFLDMALAEGNKKSGTLLLLADVAIEIGDPMTAKVILKNHRNKNAFATLIRRARLKDGDGDLDSALILMEHALQRTGKNGALREWTLANLGDMYGHAGRIDESYQTYLSALALNSQNYHALQGIGMIALNHDGDADAAQRIFTFINDHATFPELNLMLAEVAHVRKDQELERHYLKKFLHAVDRHGYRTMYNRYVAEVQVELGHPYRALSIAEDEIVERPVPESYALKAWALHHLGKDKEALDIIRRKVEGNTFEPRMIYIMGIVYLANGNAKKGEEYLRAALESQFELGPRIASSIRGALDAK